MGRLPHYNNTALSLAYSVPCHIGFTCPSCREFVKMGYMVTNASLYESSYLTLETVECPFCITHFELSTLKGGFRPNLSKCVKESSLGGRESKYYKVSAIAKNR